MIALAGMLVVAGAVFDGYVMEGGHVLVPYQPAEFVGRTNVYRNALEQLKGQPEATP